MNTGLIKENLPFDNLKKTGGQMGFSHLPLIPLASC